VSQLAEPYRMSLQAVYKHLRVLEDAGLVSRPRGPQPRPVRLEVQALDLMDTWMLPRGTAGPDRADLYVRG
jgi:DNA-binding transcriptional ArsR family regulator